MNISKRLFKFIAATAAMAAASAMATPVTDYTALTSSRVTGNHSFTRALGLDFNVIDSIWVTQLGAYDSGANGFVNPITVGIFDRNTHLLVGTSAALTTANSTLVGYDRFFDITDFILGPGSYSIVAVGFSALDPDGNSNGAIAGAPTINTGDGLIAFTGSARYSGSTALTFPISIDGGPANRYDAGTFQFHAVPEPASIALFGLALAGLGLQRRRKS